MTTCLYRPFDWRPCYFSEVSMDYPRRDLVDHVFCRKNLCVLVPRQIGTSNWQHAGVAKHVAESCLVSTKTREQNYNFPLYLYPKSEKVDLFNTDETSAVPEGRRPNLAPTFVDELSEKTGLSFVADGNGDLKKTFGPEDAMAYIYAVLHSPAYRARYAEFLRIDFPRVPLTSNVDVFRALCALGTELIGLHLMEKIGPGMTAYPVDGENVMEKVRYTEPSEHQPGRVWINRDQYFEGVPEQVWDFHVGGYQVCQKWLKDRKGRTLSFQDIQHYQRIVSALSETIRLMSEIDNSIDASGGWPIN